MDNYAYVRGQETDKAGMSAATAGHPADPGAASNPYEKLYHYDDDDYYDPHCFFSSGLAQNRKRLGFIATCSTVQCKDAGSAGYDPLLPFKEDLAEWLYKMIRAEIQPNRFFPELQSGVHLCKLGIHMQRMAVKYRKEHPEDTSLVPSKPPSLKYANATRKSPPFYCRDNISNFLDWSIEFGVKHSCRFETDDLTLRKNDRQIILHLMEVGRLGVRHGIEPPTLIKIEMELEEPLPEPEPEPEPEPTPEEPKPKPKKGVSFLDEQVQACAAECNCSIPFTVNRVSEGRYKILNKTQVGEGRSIVFVRVLRSHVMVRVGGGWETLSAYFSKMDPCRAPMDSFGGKSPTGKLKQRFESNEEEQPAPRREPTPQREPEREVEEDSAPAPVVSETYAPVPAAVPPAKPKRPATSPSPAAIAATADPMRKATPPRTRSPTKSPLRPSASTPAPRAASPKKTPVRASPSVSRESLISPTPRPNSIREPIITPRQTKASLLRTSSPSAIKTPSPANPLSPTGSGPGGISHPPWKNVPNSRSNLSRSASTPQRPASRTSGEAGPSTPNFQQPNRASTLDRKEPPTQNKRLIPVGGKNLPKSDQYNRATQRVSGKPKITSPELIRRAMEIMKDNGEVEDEEKVVRSPTDPALIAAIEEIAEEQYQCEAGEAVDVDVENLPEAGEPGPLPEPSVPIPEPSVTDLAPDSGVDTLAESKPAKVTENATVGDSSVPHLSGGDTLQDISDMITDDQDRSEMDQLEELPSDDAGEELEDEPTPVITESMIKRMEEYMRAKSEVEDSIEEFEKNVKAEAVDDEQEESGEVLEVDNIDNLEEEPIEEPKAEVYNVDNLEEEPEKKLKAEVENIDDLEEEPFKELKAEINKVDDIEEEPVEESKVEASKVDNLEEESVELEPKVETDKVDNIEKEQAASLLEVTRRLEVLESITKRQLQLESAKEDLEESIKEFQRTTSKSDEDREPVLEVVDLEPVAEEPSAEAFPAAVSEDITVVGTLPGPIMIEEGSASSGTASPPTVIAEKVEPETSSFAEKVKRLEHMIKKHPMKVPRPSDESDQGVVEVDNIAVKDIFTELPTVLMEEIQPVKSTVSNIEKKEKDDLPPPLKPIGDQYEDFEPSKLEDVLAESMEHIPAPIDETFLVEEVIEVKPMAEELVVELSEAQKEPVAEETIVVPAKVPIAPVEAEKTVVEAEDQPELQHVKMSKPPEKVEEVVVKEQFKEASPPPKAIEVEPKDDLEIEDLEVIQEAEADEEGAIAEHPLSEGEEVVMKPEKTPLPNNSTLNLAPRRYSFEAEKSEEEKEGPARSSKRSMNSSGHTSDSDRSTSSEKDTSSGYHEDYETSDGDELGTSYDKVPDVIMEQDQHTRSILKGSVRESTDSGIASGKQSLSSTPSLPTKQRMKSEDDDVFEEERAKGLNLPTEGHVREAVFTKAIESAIKPLAWGIQIPNMGELQSASIVLPSKKAIRKASDGEYDYHGRRNNLQKVISKPHTEKTDMEWDERDQARHQDKMDGQTRDEKVHKWSGTLRSSQKKKKPFRTKKYDEDDILNAISQQATAVRAKNTCPVHNAGPPVTGPPKRRPAQRPGTAPARKSAPTSRPATARPTYAAAAASNPKTTNVKAAKVETRRPSSSSVPASRPVERGSKAIAVKPASRTSNPQEVKSLSTGPKSGPMNPGTSKPVLQTTKSTPIRRTGSLREGERAPLKLSNSLPRDKIRHGPKCTDLP
ncbi:microtubule-associated protein futsch-like isoform X16 [Bolinopsis microptera]|uniref:microtubule-associated protein futsch-like isoform X16 n=1 Tax=Bolinopsis microptera TaxID=2820187 RepID=UPI00307910F8